MTLTIKDQLNLTGSGKPGSPAPNSESKASESPRANPVCLEIPVTVRSTSGTDGDASAAFREDGRTVIVFDNGAVLRLSSNLPAGQALIVSNAQGREVACRVVSGRNLPSIKGYVEVEFVEPVNDFWRIHQTVEPASVALPAALPAVLPQAKLAERPVAIPAATPMAQTPVPPVAVPTKQTGLPSNSPPNSLSGSAPSFEDIAGLVQMSATAHSVKLPVPTAGNAVTKSDTSSQIEAAVANMFVKEAEASVSKIGSSASPIRPAAVEQRPVAGDREVSSVLQKTPISGGVVAKGPLASGQISPASLSNESGKRWQFIAAGLALVLVGFGAGQFFLHKGSAPASTAATAAPPASVAQPTPAPVSAPPSAPSSAIDPAQPIQPAIQQGVVPAEQVSTIASVSVEARNPASVIPGNTRQQDAKQQSSAATRRAVIPDLKMSSPTAPRQPLAKLADGSVPTIDAASTGPVGGNPGGASLATVMHSENQPAAPPSLGPSAVPGRVIRDPKLIYSTRPVYPPMAKDTHVQGTVVVSAEVEPTGKVTAVTVESGPMLLRGAAIEAVKQWKYAPALVDGRPVTAHITVGVDFHLN